MATEFQTIVWEYYRRNARDLPWRHTLDPYKILVSEVMLQQTQSLRVIPKYLKFIEVFPNFQALNTASLHTVLSAWSGLGYNRRAKYLKDIANLVVNQHGGKLPLDLGSLNQLPGIGLNTAAAILAYACNNPVVFIETNIRSVFIHHFFTGVNEVHDNDILPLIGQSLDHKNPREWYWALMDYGSYLKKIHKNPSRASRHYMVQGKFKGSTRQLRGQIINYLVLKPNSTLEELQETLKCQNETLSLVLAQLLKEGLITKRRVAYTIN